MTKFLREIDVGPRALCRIDSTRNFELNSWRQNFKEAGLTDEHAATLQALLITGLTMEQRFVLHAMSADAAPPVPAGSSSISTESSLDYNE